MRERKTKIKPYSLTQGAIGAALLAFALPMLIGSLIQQMYTTVDAVIVGQYAGKAGLAAIDSVHTLFRFPLNFMNGLASGATVLISRSYGAEDHRGQDQAVRTACTLALVLGVVCSVAGVLLTPWLLEIMRVPEDIYSTTLSYCRIYFGGIWAMILYNMAAGILRAFGDSKRPLYVLALCALVNLMGDLLLVGGLGLGVEGAALATVFSQMVSVVCTFYLLSGTVPAVEQGPVWRPGFYRGQMAAMVKIGFPLALQSILFPVANSIVQASVNQMGTDQIAAWSICEKLDLLIWLIADTMGPALTTYTAQNLGAGKPERVKKGVRMGTGMSILAVAVVSLILYFGSPVMGHWFVSAEDGTVLVPLVSRYLRMMAPFFVFYALAEALSGACCGMGDTVGPMATTLVSVCLLRVVCIWLVLPRFGTMECIVWIYIASWLAAGFAFSGLYLWRVRGGNGPGVA